MVGYEAPCEDRYDLSSDPRHCGACDNACSDGFECRQGACVCEGSSSVCSGECVDLLTDEENCGFCGKRCGSFTCESGACVCHGSICYGFCVDLATDEKNCGTCGHQCGPQATCLGGTCYGCVGTPKPCQERSAAECETGAGCSAGTGCTGGYKNCSFFDNACTGCNVTLGCACDSKGLCNGIAKCEEQSPMACNELFGCKFGPNCSGKASACAELTDSVCASVPGCTLEVPP